jgi:hypothetical protein
MDIGPNTSELALVHHGTFGRMRGSFSEVLNDEADCP